MQLAECATSSLFCHFSTFHHFLYVSSFSLRFLMFPFLSFDYRGANHPSHNGTMTQITAHTLSVRVEPIPLNFIYLLPVKSLSCFPTRHFLSPLVCSTALPSHAAKIAHVIDTREAISLLRASSSVRSLSSSPTRVLHLQLMFLPSPSYPRTCSHDITAHIYQPTLHCLSKFLSLPNIYIF
jgi:hypothetical protein